MLALNLELENNKIENHNKKIMETKLEVENCEKELQKKLQIELQLRKQLIENQKRVQLIDQQIWNLKNVTHQKQKRMQLIDQ